MYNKINKKKKNTTDKTTKIKKKHTDKNKCHLELNVYASYKTILQLHTKARKNSYTLFLNILSHRRIYNQV